jgi:formate hydrogenlyase subunit 4
MHGHAAGIIFLPGVFLGLVYILGIKFRKSPFDLAMSHHAHQELIKGTVTEFSGKTLAMVEVAHWYENIFLLGFVYLFFVWSAGLEYPLIGLAGLRGGLLL